MIISFDLDDTLIPGIKRFKTEKRGFLQRIFGLEALRIGTIELVKLLQANGHKVYIYTTSLRSKKKIWLTFYIHGIKPDMIINQDVHNKTLREKAKNHSKYPPVFKIDVHVDDSKGVEIEGRRHNFKTIIVAEEDSNWVDSILSELHFFDDI